MKPIELFQLGCLAIVFLCAGLSAATFWEQGFAAWIWQILTMYYVGCVFVYRYREFKSKQ